MNTVSSFVGRTAVTAAMTLLIASPGMAQQVVTVTYDKPENFIDAGSSLGERVTPDSRNLKELSAYLVRLGAENLGPGDKLEVRFSDIDLAGRIEPFATPQRDLRIVTDTTWPRLKFHYLLTRGGQQTEGDASLSEMNFLRSITPVNSDPLRYEKRMLDKWMHTTLGEKSSLSPS